MDSSLLKPLMNNSNQIPDESLWHKVINGDNKSFVALYNRYWRVIYKTIIWYLKDTNLAEQIVHDVFVVLWKRRASLQIENFEKYIQATARYHVFKELKSQKLSPVQYIEDYSQINTEISINEAEAKLGLEDFENKLSEKLRGLPKRCHEIFWLSRIDNLNNDEIATKLGISKRTVENQLTTALKHLRETLKKDNSLLIFIFINAIS